MITLYDNDIKTLDRKSSKRNQFKFKRDGWQLITLERLFKQIYG